MDSNADQPQTVEHVPDGDDRRNTQQDPGGNFIDADDRPEPPHSPDPLGTPEPPTGPDAPSAPTPPNELRTGTDHFGQDGGRTTLTAGEAQRELGDAAEQSLPAMSQNNATVDEKLMGIVEQTISDSEFQPRERLEQHLRERIRDSGLDVTDAQVQDAMERVERALPEDRPV